MKNMVVDKPDVLNSKLGGFVRIDIRYCSSLIQATNKVQVRTKVR